MHWCQGRGKSGRWKRNKNRLNLGFKVQEDRHGIKGDSKVEATIETVDVDQVKKVQVKRKSYWSRDIEEAGTDEGVEKKKGFQEKLIKRSEGGKLRGGGETGFWWPNINTANIGLFNVISVVWYLIALETTTGTLEGFASEKILELIQQYDYCEKKDFHLILSFNDIRNPW